MPKINKAKVFLTKQVFIRPWGQIVTLAKAANLERKGIHQLKFEPSSLPGGNIRPESPVLMSNDNEFLVTIVNETNKILELDSSQHLGHIIITSMFGNASRTPVIKVNLVEKTNEDENKPRVIIVGDYHLQHIGDKLKESLNPIAEVEVQYSSDADMNAILDMLNHIKPDGNRKTIAVILGGNKDFDRQYWLLNHSALANNLPLGRIRELVQSMHVAYATILPRYDVKKINEKISLVNADMVGQLRPGKNLTNISLSPEIFAQKHFRTNGVELNECGTGLLATILSEHVKGIINDRLELGVVSAIENGTKKKLNLKRPLRIKGVVNFRETALMLDTGSSVNLVQPGLINEDEVRAVKNFQLLSASSDKFEPKGEGLLEVDLGPQSLKISCFITDKIPIPVILGIPFLTYYSALIDFDMQKVTLQKNVPKPIELRFTQDSNQTRPKIAPEKSETAGEGVNFVGWCSTVEPLVLITGKEPNEFKINGNTTRESAGLFSQDGLQGSEPHSRNEEISTFEEEKKIIEFCINPPEPPRPQPLSQHERNCVDKLYPTFVKIAKLEPRGLKQLDSEEIQGIAFTKITEKSLASNYSEKGEQTIRENTLASSNHIFHEIKPSKVTVAVDQSWPGSSETSDQMTPSEIRLKPGVRQKLISKVRFKNIRKRLGIDQMLRTLVTFPPYERSLKIAAIIRDQCDLKSTHRVWKYRFKFKNSAMRPQLRLPCEIPSPTIITCKSIPSRRLFQQKKEKRNKQRDVIRKSHLKGQPEHQPTIGNWEGGKVCSRLICKDPGDNQEKLSLLYSPRSRKRKKIAYQE